MTAQIHDRVFYKKKQYSIAGVKGSGLFHPADHKIFPRPCSTALWRGFLCTYAVLDRRLTLQELSIRTDDDPPTIFGAAPSQSEASQNFSAVYRDLCWDVPFDGGLLIAADFIRELYVHMGFQPAWKFVEVHELIFESGVLEQAADRSEAMADLRQKMKGVPLEPGTSAGQKKIEAWIAKSFSLDYD